MINYIKTFNEYIEEHMCYKEEGKDLNGESRKTPYCYEKR